MMHFSEPLESDPTWARLGETVGQWLSRSTVPRAGAIRAFLNHNLRCLPPAYQADFYHNLQHRWESALLELTVARLIQLMDGSFDIELENAEGRRPDFHAVIGGRSVVIEAVAPQFDREIAATRTADNELLRMIERSIPRGWGLIVHMLPHFSANESKRPLKAALGDLSRFSPPRSNDARREIKISLPQGAFQGTLIAGEFEQQLLGGPTYTTWDDSTARILGALRSKRKQTRAEKHPVLVAVNASGISSAFDNFDRALFGSSVSHVNLSGEEFATSFDRSGLLATTPLDRSFAGVLSFIGLSPFGVTGPVLYLHPEAGDLAECLNRFECRSLGRNGIIVGKSGNPIALSELSFAQP